MSLAYDRDHVENPVWGDDWRKVRDLFPLDPERVHLNNGSFGAAPQPVLDVQAEWRRRMNANHTKFFRREIRPALEEARLAVSEFLGADDAGLTLVPNATSGLSAVFDIVPLSSGDEVLVTDHAYAAVLWGLQRAAAEAGARVVTIEIPLNASAAEMTAVILDAVTPRTRFALIDHITSATARLLPVERIVPALQERGVVVAVDAAHVPGMLPVDLQALAPDFWSGNLHKWAFAPVGVAGLYAAPEWRDAMRPAVVSWRQPEGYPHRFLQYGTADLTALLAAPAGLEFIKELGYERISAHNTKLVNHGQAVLAAALGLDVASLPADEGVTMRIVTLPVDISDGSDFQAVLSERLSIEPAVSHWNGRTVLRICGQVYNHPGEYDRLAELLPSVL